MSRCPVMIPAVGDDPHIPAFGVRRSALMSDHQRMETRVRCNRERVVHVKGAVTDRRFFVTDDISTDTAPGHPRTARP